MKASGDHTLLKPQLSAICISYWGKRAGRGREKDDKQSETEVWERAANMQAGKTQLLNCPIICRLIKS